jgi:hypothetical protein
VVIGGRMKRLMQVADQMQDEFLVVPPNRGGNPMFSM